MREKLFSIPKLIGWVGALRSKPPSKEALAKERPYYELDEACSRCGQRPCAPGFGSFTTGFMLGENESHAIGGAYRICLNKECGHRELRPFVQAILDKSEEECKEADRKRTRNLARKLLATPRTSKDYRQAQETFLYWCKVCEMDPQETLSVASRTND